jgi:hypothetical protein
MRRSRGLGDVYKRQGQRSTRKIPQSVVEFKPEK